MSLLFLDFENYYDDVYSVKKITPAEYIFDDRFETICLGVAEGGNDGYVVDGPDVAKFISSLDPRRTTTVTFNSLYDNSILAWRYNFVPHRLVDSLGMARALLGSRLKSLSLGAVAEYLGVGAKGDEIHKAKGMRREDLLRNPDLWDSYRAYCLNDTLLLREIFARLHREFPKEEYAILDLVLRCCIEPTFHCDVALLRAHLARIRQAKDHLIGLVGADKEAISGNKSFVSLLQGAGVEIQYKAGARGPIPAIAKTDKFMQDLLEDPREDVQCLAAARLGVKSTIEETRSQRLITLASLPWPNNASLMPIPLRYSGAHTWRLSGDWKVNMQNLPSARMGDPILRKALIAPPRHKVVVGDLAQIEARLVAWFCNCGMLLDEFKNRRDPYSLLASIIFGVKVDKETMGGVARHIGKAGILGCGYGMGANTFFERTKAASRSQLKPHQLEQFNAVWTTDLAETSVQAYRRKYTEVRSMWSALNTALEGPWMGGRPKIADWVHGPIRITHRDGCGIVVGPCGREIRYPSPICIDNQLYWCPGKPLLLSYALRQFVEGAWREHYAGVPSKIYGAALLENIIQFLARVVMFEIAVRVNKIYGLRFIHQVHDELVYIVPEEDLDWVVGPIDPDTKRRAGGMLEAEMKIPPDWCPDLPLDCEVGFADRYGDCK